MSTIPCKRPKVTVDIHPYVVSGFVVRCSVPGCRFQYPADLQFVALKSDAEGEASRHRQAHRAAVPLVVDAGRVDVCECGWQTDPRCITKTDRAASVRTHLDTAHGLVA